MTQTTTIGRLLRSSTTNYVFGCSVPEPEVPLFGAFVKAPAQRGQSEVIGLIYNIAIEDDPFVRQMIATPDLDEAYIQDQRVNRQVPIEVSVLAIGYRNGGGFTHDLPPQPPITLDRISPCDSAEIKHFTARLDYLRLILFAPDVPADELIAVSLRLATDCQPAEDRDRFLRNAGRELAKLLNRDLARLEKLLKRLKT
ncbi:MAG: hypothetical protein HZB52_09875 [Chloroflexi bacterium]|nr:hypothetical protein [Chloroflexota bacterium]